MEETIKQKLLSDKSVIEEIQRHQWIESEKAGYDVGFEKASEDWLNRYAQAWMDYHWPARKSSSAKSDPAAKKSFQGRRAK